MSYWVPRMGKAVERALSVHPWQRCVASAGGGVAGRLAETIRASLPGFAGISVSA